MRKIYKISPSSLSDRYKKVGKRDVLVRCERCNWMRMNTGWSASLALPLASRVTKVLEVDIHDQLTEKFIPELGKGKVTKTSGIVSSIKLPIDSDHDFFIAGEYDHLAELEDGTVAVIDDKTSSVWSPEKLTPEKQIRTYQRQLNAYAYCLENPSPQKLLDFNWDCDVEQRPNQRHLSAPHINRVPKESSEPVVVSRMGINSYCVNNSIWGDGGALKLQMHRVYAEVEKDYDGLLERCDELADLTRMDSPPEQDKHCDFCKDFDRNLPYRQGN